MKLRVTMIILTATLSIVPAARGQACEVSVPTVLADWDSGMFLPNVTANLLSAKIGNAHVPVTHIERIKSFRVLILFDTSGSMSTREPDSPASYEATAMRWVRRTLDEMLDHLPAGTQVNYGVFNEQIAFGNKFSSDPKELRDILSAATDKLKKVDKGKTALFDAIHDGLGVFGPAQEGDTVLVITDGDDNRSGTTLTVLEKDLAAKAIRVFTILMWNDTARIQKQFGGGDPMQELAERTGGTEHTVNTKSLVWMEEKSSAPVRKDLQRFWHEEVLSAYALRFSVPPGTKEGQKWLLGVDRSANPKAKIVAAYPNRLHGCPSTTSSK